MRDEIFDAQKITEWESAGSLDDMRKAVDELLEGYGLELVIAVSGSELRVAEELVFKIAPRRVDLTSMLRGFKDSNINKALKKGWQPKTPEQMYVDYSDDWGGEDWEAYGTEIMEEVSKQPLMASKVTDDLKRGYSYAAWSFLYEGE